MSCSCKHNQDNISHEKKRVETLRELFIKRMTVDSESQDKRRRNYNQAIFRYYTNDDIDSWNSAAEKYGFPKKKYGDTTCCLEGLDMDMVLQCFDNAAKDLRRTWCDVEDCRRK